MPLQIPPAGSLHPCLQEKDLKITILCTISTFVNSYDYLRRFAPYFIHRYMGSFILTGWPSFKTCRVCAPCRLLTFSCVRIFLRVCHDVSRRASISQQRRTRVRLLHQSLGHLHCSLSATICLRKIWISYYIHKSIANYLQNIWNL